MAAELVPPGGHTALSDPRSVLLELVDETRQRPGMTEAEAYAFLAGADTSTFGLPKIIVAAAQVHTGAMIALVPSEDDLRRLSVPGGEPRDQLHTTLVYLGESDDLSANVKRALVERAETLADGWGGPISAEGFSINVFNPPGVARDDGKQRDACIVLGLSGGDLDLIHRSIESMARGVQQDHTYPLPEQHKPWIPHVTLAYTDDVGRVVALADRVGPITFDRLRLAFGGEVIDVPLDGVMIAHGTHDQKKHGRRYGTPQEIDARVKRLDDALSKTYKTLSTHRLFRDENGVWDYDRDKIHRQIVDQAFAKAADVPNDRRALFMGGPMGAGKSTVLKNNLGVGTNDYMTIDPDEIKRELAQRGLVPEVPGEPDLAPLERATLVHEESMRIANMMMDRALAEGKNVIWDTSMLNTAATSYWMKQARKDGYEDMRGVFVMVPNEVSAKRIRARYREGLRDFLTKRGSEKDVGGRHVPTALVNARPNSHTLQSFKSIRKYFDDWKLYDNSVDGQSATLTEQKGGK